MSSEAQPESETRPRVSIALPAGAMRERIIGRLRGSGVDIDILDVADDPADLAAEMRRSRSDIVLVHSDDVDARELDALVSSTVEGEDPGFAVIGEHDPARRARLFAAGASEVWTGDERPPELGSALEALAGGGARGPEVRGSEAQPRLADFLTQAPCMRRFVEVVRRVVDVDTTLLISGPTGVGKERLARAIHAEGARAAGPFVAVNCGAIPEALLESELFGHEKGAFTGAEKQRRGHFELASGGTIFLDEIGEMPSHLQVKLLTVLQRHEVVRVGGQQTIPVDVRVVAATNRDLQAEAESGRFRADLFYRLSIVPLVIPALQDRPSDIPDLAGRFIAHFREVMPQTRVESISNAAVDALLAHSWPGNVRELINVIERAMVLGRGREITLDELPPAIARPQLSPAAPVSPVTPVGARALPPSWRELSLKSVRDHAVREAESAYLEALLTETAGHIGETARRAKVSSRALYDRMKRYDLRKEDFKTE
ncbi:MAG: sigma 54-interacting transcriptional regulator [Planctomycetes bacterium]|nr:sigma 54-interacting transcriptional regulator [Planctomycetota bacterium]